MSVVCVCLFVCVCLCVCLCRLIKLSLLTRHTVTLLTTALSLSPTVCSKVWSG